MYKTRLGFTMIELIFVIVVIGILASVAIPKMATNRDNAIVETCIHEFNQYLREIQMAYMDTDDLNTWNNTKVSEVTNLSISTSLEGNGIHANINHAKIPGWKRYVCNGDKVGFAEPRVSGSGNRYEIRFGALNLPATPTPIQKKFYDKIIKQYGKRVSIISF